MEYCFVIDNKEKRRDEILHRFYSESPILSGDIVEIEKGAKHDLYGVSLVVTSVSKGIKYAFVKKI